MNNTLRSVLALLLGCTAMMIMLTASVAAFLFYLLAVWLEPDYGDDIDGNSK